MIPAFGNFGKIDFAVFVSSPEEEQTTHKLVTSC